MASDMVNGELWHEADDFVILHSQDANSGAVRSTEVEPQEVDSPQTAAKQLLNTENSPTPSSGRIGRHRRNRTAFLDGAALEVISISSSTDLDFFPAKYAKDHYLDDPYYEEGPGPALNIDEWLESSQPAFHVAQTSQLQYYEMANNPNAFPSLDSPISNTNSRVGSSPTSATGPGQTNGNNMSNNANYMAPLPAGHQQDLNFLYGQIQELSTLLRANREKVATLTKNAEEIAKRSNQSFGDEADKKDTDAARIRELELELAKSNHLITLYKHEQKENTALLANYEDALGTATEQIRNYCLGIEDRFLSQRRHYNNLLQQEKDEHLQSRLDRDHWYCETLKVCEMIRMANRLRMEEWGEEYTVVAALQTQVRCLRRCLGLEAEKPEEEMGYPYLKDCPLNDQN